MPSKRIIPCLDIKDGRTVKGINFVGIRDAGDPVELAAKYAREGADELVFLDITATVEGRKTFAALVKQIAAEINIPFTVGGGISAVDDAELLLRNGADKISVNSSAIRRPELINELAAAFGNQCVVVAIDGRQEENGQWMVYTHGGRNKTDLEVLGWAAEVEQRGAGEILMTSMNNDGTKNGFALELCKNLGSQLNIPIIASGGAGTMSHFAEALQLKEVDAALAASVFHYGEIPIPTLKRHLQEKGVSIRI
ncbi:MAG: imidazole glycerol phosphate synthase subunit HisF [Luteibaculum sp.]